MLDLTISGKDFGGWLSMEVFRSIQNMAGTFWLDLARPRLARDPKVRAGDLCRIRINNLPTDPKFQIIQGYIEALSGGGDQNSVKFTASGKDRTGDLVDSDIEKLGEWNGLKFEELAADIAADFNIQVVLDGNIDTGDVIPNVNYDQGDTYQMLLAEYAKQKQLLVYTLGSGELFITRAATERGEIRLIEGINVKTHTIDLDWADVFKTYLVKGSRQSKDNEPEEEVTQVEGCAIDNRFPRKRTTIITPDTEQTAESAQKLADWNATTRLAQAEAYTVTVQGWFPVLNQIAYTRIDSYGLDADMLIESFTLVADEEGKRTTFGLVHPRSFALLSGNTIEADSKDSALLNIQ